jgi:hypothetical protein
VAFVSNWVKHAKLFLLLQSRSAIGVNYPGALCSMAALRRAFRNRHRQIMLRVAGGRVILGIDPLGPAVSDGYAAKKTSGGALQDQ